MNVEKAFWQTDGNTVRMTMPLQKVDTEKRIVSGFATLDNIDTSDDIVLASASANAFENFRGNIRLMHQPIPAGKLVNFREEEYYDARTQKFYRGIYVDVYVSKGAPEVWEMVLDGTLTGFSIGGNVTDQESQFVADANRVLRFIKGYDLVELSLVDSPANQLCNVFSVQKAADGTTSVEGMIAEVKTENVFFCAKDEIAFTSSDETKACNNCGAEAKNIGWFESDGGDKTEKVNSIVAGFKKTDTPEGRENIMANENVANIDITEAEELEVEDQVDATPLVTKDEAAAGEAEAVAEEATEVQEDPAVEALAEEIAEELVEELTEDPAEEATETPEEEAAEDAEETSNGIGKMFAELSESIQKALQTSQTETAAELAKVNERLAAVDAVVSKIEELGAKHAELAEKFDAVNTQLDNVEKRFQAINETVGVKKSGDLGGSTEDKLEKSSKSIWNGRFLGSLDNV